MDERHQHILTVLRSRRSRLSIRAVAKLTGIPKSTVQRLLVELWSRGAVERGRGPWYRYRPTRRRDHASVGQVGQLPINASATPHEG